MEATPKTRDPAGKDIFASTTRMRDGRSSESGAWLAEPSGDGGDGSSGQAPAQDRSSGRVPPPAEKRVLVVDDNEDAAESLAQYVGTLGYATRVAHDGLEALRVASEFLPNVVLLDIGLPVMDGYEVADRLRKIPGLEDTHLLAVTGYGQDTDREQSRQAGFSAHLVKPIDLKSFRRILESPPSGRDPRG